MSFVSELKRRKVFQVAAVYLVVAWLIMQVVDVVNEPLRLPEWFATVAILLVAIGFPIALIISWAFDLTPEGVVKDTGTVQSGGRRIEYVFIGLLAIAVGTLLYREFTPPEQPVEVVAEEDQREVLPNSVAVLLCDNLSPDPDDAFFAASIHEEILNQLAKVRGLNVIARTSVMQYANAPPAIPQIAEELNVQTVMECSVRYAGDDIMVTAQLIDPETNSHLWSDAYPGSLRDLSTVFAMQADIAMNIANALQAEFSLAEQESIGRMPTSSPEAYTLYLRALDARRAPPGSEASRLAVPLLQETVEIDPEFAIAHAHLANLTHSSSFFFGSAPVRVRLATISAQRALALDPNLGYAYITLAEIHRVRLEGPEAREDYRRAVLLSPNDSEVLTEFALFQSETMQHLDAVRFAQRGVALDPNNRIYQNRLGRVLERAGNFQSAAIAWIAAESPLRGRMAQIYSQIRNGENDTALANLRDLEGALTEIPDNSFDGQDAFAGIAYGSSRVGRSEDATRMRSQITETPIPVLAYLAIGDREAALERLNQLTGVVDYRDPGILRGEMFHIKANPWNDPILDQPEFVEVRSRLGFRE